MKAINIRLVLVVVFSVIVNMANGQVKKKRSLPKKVKIERVATITSLLETNKENRVYPLSLKKNIHTVMIMAHGERNNRTQPLPSMRWEPITLVAAPKRQPNLPGSVLNQQIEMQLGNAGGSRPGNVRYCIDGMMVMDNSIMARNNLSHPSFPNKRK